MSNYCELTSCALSRHTHTTLEQWQRECWNASSDGLHAWDTTDVEWMAMLRRSWCNKFFPQLFWDSGICLLFLVNNKMSDHIQIIIWKKRIHRKWKTSPSWLGKQYRFGNKERSYSKIYTYHDTLFIYHNLKYYCYYIDDGRYLKWMKND